MVEMKSKVMMVDPALALAWLQRNIATNRPMRPTVVENYADEMRRGEWHLTHQGIALDIDGNLIDGQHRLAAVIKANVIVPMMVTVNAPRASFVALDGGVKRTLADRLTMPPDVVTVLTAAWCLKKNSTQRITAATVSALASTEFGAKTKRLFGTSPLTRRRVTSCAIAPAEPARARAAARSVTIGMPLATPSSTIPASRPALWLSTTARISKASQWRTSPWAVLPSRPAKCPSQ